MIFRVMFTHFSQKDSKDGLLCVVMAPNEEALIAYLDKTHNHGSWEDASNDEEEGSWSPAEPLTDEEAARAEALGLTVDREYDSIEGPHAALLRFCHGDTFNEPTDLYYGFTHLFWEPVEVVDDFTPGAIAAVLGDRFVVIDEVAS